MVSLPDWRAGCLPVWLPEESQLEGQPADLDTSLSLSLSLFATLFLLSATRNKLYAGKLT